LHLLVRAGKTTVSLLLDKIVSGYRRNPRSCCCLFSRSCTSCSTDTAVFLVGAWYWMYAI